MVAPGALVAPSLLGLDGGAAVLVLVLDVAHDVIVTVRRIPAPGALVAPVLFLLHPLHLLHTHTENYQKNLIFFTHSLPTTAITVFFNNACTPTTVIARLTIELRFGP